MSAQGAAPGELGSGLRGSETLNGDAKSLPLIRHAGKIASGVTITFTYQNGVIDCYWSDSTHGEPRGQALRKYRRIRHEFMQRVAGALGHNIAALETDGDGNLTGYFPVSVPKAGRA